MIEDEDNGYKVRMPSDGFEVWHFWLESEKCQLKPNGVEVVWCGNKFAALQTSKLYDLGEISIKNEIG